MTQTELLAEVAKQGVVVSKDQLRRWRGRGLLHAPAKSSDGRGAGVKATYDDTHLRQLVAIVKTLRENKRTDRALWRLWWQGYAIDDAQIIRQLHRTLREVEKLRAQFQRIEKFDGTSKRFERATRARLKDTGLSQIRRRIGKQRFTSLVNVLPRLVTGLYDGMDTENEALILHALGLIESPDPALTKRFAPRGFLRVLTSFFTHERLSGGLHDLDVSTLRTVRDALGRFLPTVQALIGSALVAPQLVGIEESGLATKLIMPIVEAPPHFLVLAVLGTRIFPQFEVALSLFANLSQVLGGELAISSLETETAR